MTEKRNTSQPTGPRQHEKLRRINYDYCTHPKYERASHLHEMLKSVLHLAFWINNNNKLCMKSLGVVAEMAKGIERWSNGDEIGFVPWEEEEMSDDSRLELLACRCSHSLCHPGHELSRKSKHCRHRMRCKAEDH
jgi:hypothetical protein